MTNNKELYKSKDVEEANRIYDEACMYLSSKEEKRERRKGQFYTDGEYIWGPFNDDDDDNFLIGNSTNKQQDEDRDVFVDDVDVAVSVTSSVVEKDEDVSVINFKKDLNSLAGDFDKLIEEVEDFRLNRVNSNDKMDEIENGNEKYRVLDFCGLRRSRSREREDTDWKMGFQKDKYSCQCFGDGNHQSTSCFPTVEKLAKSMGRFPVSQYNESTSILSPSPELSVTISQEIKPTTSFFGFREFSHCHGCFPSNSYKLSEASVSSFDPLENIQLHQEVKGIKPVGHQTEATMKSTSISPYDFRGMQNMEFSQSKLPSFIEMEKRLSDDLNLTDNKGIKPAGFRTESSSRKSPIPRYSFQGLQNTDELSRSVGKLPSVISTNENSQNNLIKPAGIKTESAGRKSPISKYSFQGLENTRNSQSVGKLPSHIDQESQELKPGIKPAGCMTSNADGKPRNILPSEFPGIQHITSPQKLGRLPTSKPPSPSPERKERKFLPGEFPGLQNIPHLEPFKGKLPTSNIPEPCGFKPAGVIGESTKGMSHKTLPGEFQGLQNLSKIRKPPRIGKLPTSSKIVPVGAKPAGHKIEPLEVQPKVIATEFPGFQNIEKIQKPKGKLPTSSYHNPKGHKPAGYLGESPERKSRTVLPTDFQGIPDENYEPQHVGSLPTTLRKEEYKKEKPKRKFLPGEFPGLQNLENNHEPVGLLPKTQFVELKKPRPVCEGRPKSPLPSEFQGLQNIKELNTSPGRLPTNLKYKDEQGFKPAGHLVESPERKKRSELPLEYAGCQKLKEIMGVGKLPTVGPEIKGGSAGRQSRSVVPKITANSRG